MPTHEELMAEIKEVKELARANGLAIATLDKDLAVHKSKTSRFSMFLSAVVSLGVTIAALLTKGCM